MAADTLTKVFDHFADADGARQELLASGFPAARMHLRLRSHEAVSADGHLIIGDSGTAANAVEGIFQLLGGTPRNGAEPKHHHHQAARHGIYQLSVEVDDPHEQTRAAVIMKQFGGTDIAYLWQ